MGAYERRWVLGLIILLEAFSGGVALAAPSARAIMEKNEEVRRVDDLTSQAELVTAGGGSPERRKKFTWWRKLAQDRVHYHTLTRFHEPAEVRGQGILFLENGAENDVQMYLPTFKKVRRVESQQQSGSFMGSEFSYSDIATPHVDDYQYSFVREETCPTPEASKVRCWVIEAVPATEAVRERTGFSKVRSWVRSDQSMQVQVEYENLENVLFKRLLATDIREIDPVKHKRMAMNVKMENLKTGRTTQLLFSQVKANAGVADSIFTVTNLQKER
jgi:outer membrane lipoprotein-sorting protein